MKHLGYLAAIVALAGCQPTPTKDAAAPKAGEKLVWKPDHARTLLPVAEGNQWVYVVSVTQADGTSLPDQVVTYRMSKVEPTGVDVDALLSASGPPAERFRWSVTEKGIQQSKRAGVSGYETPMLLIPFPYQPGKTWTYEGLASAPDGKATRLKMSFTATGPEEVDTDKGRVPAFAVEGVGEQTLEGKPVRVEQKSWWVPGQGLARSIRKLIGSSGVVEQKMWLRTLSLKETTR